MTFEQEDFRRTGRVNDKVNGADAGPEHSGEWTFRSEIERARDVLSDQGARLAGRMKAGLGEAAERQKEDLATATSDASLEIRSLSRGLADYPNLWTVVNEAADAVQRGSDAIQHKPLSEIGDDAVQACRRYPVAVAAGSIILGALVAQLIKSADAPAMTISEGGK